MLHARLADRYVLRLEEGEEAVSAMRRFLVEQNILAGYFVAWGAFSRLRLQYNRLVEGKYHPLTLDLDRQVEVASLLGNMAMLDEQPTVHVHVVVGDEDLRTYSGHLAEGVVRPTLEVFVTSLPRALHRIWNPHLNVAALDPEEALEEGERLAAWP